MDIEKLQKEVYKNTIALGYIVDKETTVDKLQEELIEFEDCKDGDKRDLYKLKSAKSDAEFKSIFESKIKDTQMDEIPDMFFVMLSYCEERNINFETLVNYKLKYNSIRKGVLSV